MKGDEIRVRDAKVPIVIPRDHFAVLLVVEEEEEEEVVTWRRGIDLQSRRVDSRITGLKEDILGVFKLPIGMGSTV